MGDDFFGGFVRRFIFYRIIWGVIAFIALVIGGVYFIISWVYREMLLEMAYHQRYGANWQVEFEKNYGPLSQAHGKIAIGVMSMVAVAAIVIWNLRGKFRKRRRIRRSHRA